MRSVLGESLGRRIFFPECLVVDDQAERQLGSWEGLLCESCTELSTGGGRFFFGIARYLPRTSSTVIFSALAPWNTGFCCSAFSMLEMGSAFAEKFLAIFAEFKTVGILNRCRVPSFEHGRMRYREGS